MNRWDLAYTFILHLLLRHFTTSYCLTGVRLAQSVQYLGYGVDCQDFVVGFPQEEGDFSPSKRPPRRWGTPSILFE